MTDYAVIPNNTNLDIMSNIFNLTRDYEVSDHKHVQEKDYSSLCKSRNKDAE